MSFLDNVLIGVMIVSIFCIGWSGNDWYRSYSNHRSYDGLRFVFNNSQSDAIAQASKFDKYGNWVCVNIKGMDYNDAINTCEHETAHEIFAIECSKNIDKCMEAIQK